MKILITLDIKIDWGIKSKNNLSVVIIKSVIIITNHKREDKADAKLGFKKEEDMSGWYFFV